jgi:hypothetical protein
MLLTAIAPSLQGLKATCDQYYPCPYIHGDDQPAQCGTYDCADYCQDDHRVELIWKPEAETLFDAIIEANEQVLDHPEHGKIFGTLKKLVALMKERNLTPTKPIKPGAIDLLVKHAGRGVGKYATVFGSYLDATSAARINTMLTHISQALAHTQKFIKTKSDADKAIIAKHIGAIAQELIQFIDIEATGKPHLEVIHQINQTIPLIIEELRQGIEDNPIKKAITPLIDAHGLLTPQAIDFINAVCTYMQNEWEDLEDELEADIDPLIIELLPTIAYQIGKYLTPEQGAIVIQLLYDVYNISMQAEVCIANNDPLAQQLMLANCGKLIQDVCMQFQLPKLTNEMITILKACNQELPVIIKQFNNGVARAQR